MLYLEPDRHKGSESEAINHQMRVEWPSKRDAYAGTHYTDRRDRQDM